MDFLGQIYHKICYNINIKGKIKNETFCKTTYI
jgi:hypothetical protein